MSDVLHDSGYNGHLVSLAGVIGKDGAGLHVWSSMPAPTTDAVIIVDPNPRRMWVLITNEGTVDVLIAFDGVFTNGYFTLKPNGSFKIDKDLSWTGGVWAKTSSGTGSLGLLSASIDQI